MQRTDDEAAPSLEDIAGLFTPRPDGTPASAQYPNSDLHLRAILSLVQQGFASLSHAPADLYEYDAPPSSRLIQVSPVHLPVSHSHGGQDLKDEIWSSFRNLATANPDAAIEVNFARQPLGYFSRELSTLVTAGNMDPGRVLEFMVVKGLRKLGVFGEARAGRAPGGDATFTGYAMTWLVVAPAGMAVLTERQGKLDGLMFGKAGTSQASDPLAYLDALRKTQQ